MTHFLLDLQEGHQRSVFVLASDDPPYTSHDFGPDNQSLVFAPALGSLSATIDLNFQNIENDEVDADGHAYHLSEDCQLENEAGLQIELEARASKPKASNGTASKSSAEVQNMLARR